MPAPGVLGMVRLDVTGQRGDKLGLGCSVGVEERFTHALWRGVRYQGGLLLAVRLGGGRRVAREKKRWSAGSVSRAYAQWGHGDHLERV
jgi:hypothetical protein